MPTMTIGGMVPAAIRAQCRLVQPQLLLALERGAIVEGSLAVQHVQRRIYAIRWSIGVAWRQPDANGDLALVHHAREVSTLRSPETDDTQCPVPRHSQRETREARRRPRPVAKTGTPYLPFAGTQAPTSCNAALHAQRHAGSSVNTNARSQTFPQRAVSRPRLRQHEEPKGVRTRVPSQRS